MSTAAIRRADLVMPPDDVEALLQRAMVVRIGSVGTDGGPYVMPTLFVYAERTIHIHTTAALGHFRRNVAHEPRVCCEISEPGTVFPYGTFACDTTLSYASIIAFGALREIPVAVDKTRFFDRFMAKYADPAWRRPDGFYPRLDDTRVFGIELRQITGKLIALPALSQRWPMANRTKSPHAVAPRSN